MSQLTKSLVLSAVTVLAVASAAGTASAQLTPAAPAPAPVATTTTSTTAVGTGATAPGGALDATPVENPDIGDPGCFMIDQLSGFRGRVGGGVQYYGPIGAAYNNFSTTLAPQIQLSATNSSITTTETSIKSWSIWLAPSLDYFIVQNLSVGGLFAVDTGFGSYDSKTTTQTVGGISTASAKGDLPTVTSFTLMPRVGYLIRISDRLSFWPRVGIGYFSGTNALVESRTVPSADGKSSTTQNITTSTNVHSLIMQLDVGLIYQITDNVFFRVAPGVAFSSGGAGKVTYAASNGTNAPPDQSGDGSVFQFELSTGFGANFSL